MKPARSVMVTSTLPSRAQSASTSATTSGAVTTVRITSTSFITGAGLKKCSPMTCSGREVATEISVTLSEEVLVARIASGRQIRSSSPKIFRLRSSRSGTASMTRSTSPQRGQSDGEGDPVQERVALLGGELAPGDRAVGGADQGGPPPFQRVLGDLHREHVDPVAGEHLDDAGAHGAQADDADAGDLACHSRLHRYRAARQVNGR